MPNDRQYEFVYVLAPTVANAGVEALQSMLDEQIRKLGGTVENTDLWGRRKLAYPIGNFTEGIYVVQLLRGPGDMVTELERRLRVNDDVLRYLTVRVDDDLRKARRAAEKRKAEAARRRAARGPQGEPAGGAPADGGPSPEVTPPAAESAPPPAALDGAAPPEGAPSPPAGPSASDAAVDEPPSAPPAAADESAGS